MSADVPTIQFASAVYDGEPPFDDPAEAYHEAARLYPSTAGRQARRIELLARRTELQRSAERASRIHPHRPLCALPAPVWPAGSLADVLGQRRTRLPDPDSCLSIDALGTTLAGGYGCRAGEPRRRHVPSGGALYPLELYPLVVRSDALAAARYHYDPYAHRLERLGELDLDWLAATLVDPAIARNASALIAISGMFWRSRFKYGQRGYRFALLEAGHVAQNMLLLATALGVAAAPLGGFYDAALDQLLELDGVDESVLYLIALGDFRSTGE